MGPSPSNRALWLALRLLKKLIKAATAVAPFSDPRTLECPRCRAVYIAAKLVEDEARTKFKKW